jgi:hypothetical protein
MSESRLRAGEWVEVRSREDILRTLDEKGQLDGLPFMPEMLAFCGQRFQVFKRAHKTCDTVNDYKGRRMHRTVHLDDVRCDGLTHGGCEAGCLIYWKEAWLRRVADQQSRERSTPLESVGRCTEAQLHAATRREPLDVADPAYMCQATQVPAATQPLAWWDVRQYVEDYTSGNIGLLRLTKGIAFRTYDNIIKSGLGVGAPLRRLYGVFKIVLGGTPYPAWPVKIRAGPRTPSICVDLQPGELVRVKDYDAILETIDETNRNRGMTFDAEMVPYCGGTYQVLRRVTHIINERSGKMQTLSNPCIILSGVVCQSRYSACRLFCPRSIYPYWREIWLERVGQPASVAEPGGRSEDGMVPAANRV